MTLEKLLSILCEKGWKPFGMKCTFEYVDILCNQPYRFKHLNARVGASLRELVSKESGLWQFVCENGMYNKLEICDNRTKNYDAYYNESDDTYSGDDYGYRVIESALKDESELEEFLLQNIKIDE